jgi:hypothetical protein
MSSSLFGLVSLAGNASLDELRARGSLDSTGLARELAAMLREGDITLSLAPQSDLALAPPADGSALGRVVSLIREDGASGLRKLVKEDQGVFVRAIEAALAGGDAAASITVRPTSSGFRRMF